MKAQPLKNTTEAINKIKEPMTDIEKMLADASALNSAGNYSGAITLAYNASDKIAVAYLLGTTGQQYSAGWDTYDLFDATLRKPERHPAFLQQIREIAGDVYVLREAYVPALLDETTSKDAKQMIDQVEALRGLMVDILR